MPSVIFVAPFFLETTLRFVDAAADLPGVRLGLVSQDPESKLPPGLRAKLAGHWRIDDGLDPGQITAAAHGLAPRIGRAERVIGTLEQLQVPLAQVREALGLPGLGVVAAEHFRDKARMKTALRAAGLPCARHRLAHTAADAWAFAEEVGFPLVAKPPAGAGAKSTFRIDGAEQLREALAAMPPSAADPTLLEEFITGDEHSFDSACIHGRPVWHSITRYFPTPLDVLQNPWIQWCVLLPRDISGPEYDPIREAGFRSLQVLGMDTGLSHMEWFRRRDGSVAISEVGARPPGAQFTTLMSYAHDHDFYRAWAKLAVYDAFDPPERKFAVGAAFVRGQGNGRVKAIHGLERAHAEVGPYVVEAKLPQPGSSPSGTYEGDGYVIVRHPETSVVEKALARLVSTIQVELG